MARPTPNLPALFTQALKAFESSDSAFRVLCSLRSSAQTDFLAEPPRRTPNHILVLDSSFNPPTLAHHRMAISALSDPRHQTSASRILLLLAVNNADKAPKPAAFPQRLAMMYIFAQGILAECARKKDSNVSIGCEAVDIAVTTEPYFHAKARAIATNAFYHDVEDRSEQVYLTGYDTLIRVFNPKYYPNDSMKVVLDPFFARARLRVTMRTDDEWGDAAQQISYLDELRAGRAEWVDRIELVRGRKDGEAIISSTKVRDAAQRRDWAVLTELVSEGVVNWIRENGLYASR
ncbi:hypothetical protein GGS21DRAFT_160271 [Xylaria nigripes]|nr:hypothetical protein GGS21DRAFT_160271 [Xylaria nigripes]